VPTVTDASVAPPSDLMRRIRVLQARQRIEDVARRLLYDAEGAGATARFHVNVKTRLLLLCAAASDEWPDRYRIADRAAAVYDATSDVLHSRRTYVDVPEALLREWEDVVDELRTVAAQAADRQR
jgi:hypothetical protein